MHVAVYSVGVVVGACLVVSRESSDCQWVARAVSRYAGFWGCLDPRCGGYYLELLRRTCDLSATGTCGLAPGICFRELQLERC